MSGLRDGFEVLPALRTARLHLRAPEMDDCAAIAVLADDFETTRWLGRLPHPYTLADARHFISAIAPQELTWTIRNRGDDALMGVIGIHGPDADGSAPEFGYWLGRLHWGSGYATEAASEVVRFAFSDVGLEALQSGYFKGNARSARVLEKLGFAGCGTSSVHCLARASEVTRVDMVLSRARWASADASETSRPA